MAMVFKSKKGLTDPIEKQTKSPGPGDYIPQTIAKKIHFNKEPFLSSFNGTFHPRNNYPGPGSYFQDISLLNFLQKKTKENTSETNENQSVSQLKLRESTTIGYTPTENKTSENLGFNSKTKRFKYPEHIKPGPAYYFPKINKFYKNKINRIKENEFNSKRKQKTRIVEEFNFVPSIPSKNQNYGFDILKDGKVVRAKDPELEKTCTGEKGNSVGPGAYEIEKTNNLQFKTRPQWTISKEAKKDFFTKNDNPSLFSTNMSDYSTNFNSSNLLSSITANKFYVDENLNVIEFSPYNISNNNISDYSQTNLNVDNSVLLFPREKLKPKNKPITNGLYYHEFFKKIPTRELFKTNTNPGPGFYIDRFKHSSFRFKSVPENKQFFGSRLERFYNINKSYDYYNYIDDSYGDENKTKSNSFNSLAPFTCKDQRFKTPYYLREKFENPSPFDYNNNKMKKTKSFSNFEKFNTSQKRFIEEKNVKWRNDLPGPGYYNPDKIRKHISTKKIINPINKKSNKDKSLNIYINPINYKINTIEYLNNRKINSTNLKNVTFFRCNPKINKSSSCGNIVPSPGTYYKEKKYEYKQIMPPFNSSSEKKVEIKRKSDINVGSGQYNHDSYFDWHKKSFNISYV